jgi:methylase of polypeptide subunit release factors
MKIREILNKATIKLEGSSPRPRFEAELLLAHFLKKDRVYLHTFDNIEVENSHEFF